MREIAAVINMQTSSRWQSRLSFENPIYFCVIIYLPVHSLQSRAIPPARITQLHSHLYLRRASVSKSLKAKLDPRSAHRPPRSARAAGACQISALAFGYDDSVNASLTKRLRLHFYKSAPDKL